MKIFLVCNILLDGENAQTTHMLELFTNLKKLNNPILLFSPKPTHVKFNFSENIYIPFLHIPKLSTISYQMNLFIYLMFYSITKTPDVIYNRQSAFSFVPLIISKIFRLSYLTEVNGLILEEMNMSGRSSGLKLRIAKLCESVNYHYAKMIVVVTNGLKDNLIKLYNIHPDHIGVISNGVNTDIFKPLDIEDAKKYINLDQALSYVVFIGNLALWQGVEYLIRAAPLIKENFPEVRFLVVGDGIMREALERTAREQNVEDKFIFKGVVPYEQVPLYINASIICVAPFIVARNAKIGLSPLKMYEYLACDKPVVASNIPGVKDLLDMSGGGIVVEPENPSELASAIIKLLKNENLRKEMGIKGRKHIMENHSWEAVVKRVAFICETALARHRGEDDRSN